MHQNANCRELYNTVLQYDGRLYPDVLAPWVEANPEKPLWLRAFAARKGSPVPAAEPEELCRLYALGRVNELLLLAFQKGPENRDAWPRISREEYAAFAGAMGLTATEAPAFSPFYHEIVEVEEADDPEQPIALMATLWPCLMLGDILFSRAGVRVRGGRRFVRKEVAESSTLYWAFRRENRPHHDLSHGWGHNSQWATDLRRDYRIGGELYYNVDGERDLGMAELPTPEDDDLTRAERIELLTHRCFVVTMKPHADRWPYDDTLHAKR